MAALLMLVASMVTSPCVMLHTMAPRRGVGPGVTLPRLMGPLVILRVRLSWKVHGKWGLRGQWGWHWSRDCSVLEAETKRPDVEQGGRPLSHLRRVVDLARLAVRTARLCWRMVEALEHRVARRRRKLRHWGLMLSQPILSRPKRGKVWEIEAQTTECFVPPYCPLSLPVMERIRRGLVPREV
eukprot:jgi/Botrbrau1/11741/Bobra.0195s0068.1